MADKNTGNTLPTNQNLKVGKLEAQKLPALFAIIRIRGEVGVNKKIARTLELLHLHKKHRCVLVPANKNYLGMVSKVKDYCTFGEVDEQTVKELLQRRGRIVGGQKLTEAFLKEKRLNFDNLSKKLISGEIQLKDIEGIKPFFKLHPPVGGFEREGIKKPFSMHGALGYRGSNINKLLRRMI